MEFQSLLENATSYNRFNTQSPITELTETTQKILEFICRTKGYNINEQFVVSDTDTLTLAANTYHSISYVIISGTASITIGGTTLTPVSQGYSGDDTATTLLTNSTTITGLSTGTLISVKTIR